MKPERIGEEGEMTPGQFAAGTWIVLCFGNSPTHDPKVRDGKAFAGEWVGFSTRRAADAYVKRAGDSVIAVFKMDLISD